MVARAALLVAGAKVTGGASMLLLTIWIARHLPPSEYGLFAIATAALLLVDGIIGSSVDAAVIRVAGEPGQLSDHAGRAGVILKLAVGSATAALAALVLYATGRADAARLAAIVGAGGTGMLVLRSVQVQLQLEERFGWYAAAELMHMSVRVAGVLLLLSAGVRSADALLAMYALAPWCAAAVFSVAALRAWTLAVGNIRGVREVANVTAITVTTTGVGALVARLDLFVIGAAGAPDQAGIFAAASTLALIPTWLGAYLAPAFSGRILPYCRQGRMRPFLWDVQRLLILAGAAAIAGGVLVVPALIGHVLPASYAPAARVVPILIVAGAAGLVTFPLVLHTLLFLSPRTYVVMDLVSLPVLVPLYVLAARQWGAVGVAWVTSGTAVAKAIVAQAAAAAAVRRAESQPVLAGLGA